MDFGNRQMKFTPLTVADKLQVVAGETPDVVLGTDTLTVVLLGSGMGLVVVIFGVLCVLVCFDTMLFRSRNPQTKPALDSVEEPATLEQLESLIEIALEKKRTQLA